MTSWGELLDIFINGNVVLFSTATNGVGAGSRMLAFSYCKPEDTHPTTLFQLLEPDQVYKSSEYHHIPFELVREKGLLPDEFHAEVSKVLAENVPFSYNPAFQTKVLVEMERMMPVPIYDFVMFLRAADSRIALKDDDITKAASLADLCKLVKRNYISVPFARVMKDYNAAFSGRMESDLPVVVNANALRILWGDLQAKPLTTF